MATADEKQAKQDARDAARSSLTVGQQRLAAQTGPAGSAFPQRRLRTAGDLSRYAIGGFLSDPNAPLPTSTEGGRKPPAAGGGTPVTRPPQRPPGGSGGGSGSGLNRIGAPGKTMRPNPADTLPARLTSRRPPAPAVSVGGGPKSYPSKSSGIPSAYRGPTIPIAGSASGGPKSSATKPGGVPNYATPGATRLAQERAPSTTSTTGTRTGAKLAGGSTTPLRPTANVAKTGAGGAKKAGGSTTKLKKAAAKSGGTHAANRRAGSGQRQRAVRAATRPRATKSTRAAGKQSTRSAGRGSQTGGGTHSVGF